ncbi:MAG: group 1 glycosyl transferase [Crocinitomicaceae bacterium]|nr:group 1 glycosyl transferase [Crocinitomicaceae bacterium]|tara:strand:- start:2822 stop:3955 length:1134 start_codon:yes stop_codon:yes gene_type:complete
MKILYHHRIASKDGQFVHIDEIVSALKELGHEVSVIGPDVAESGDFGHDGGFVTKLKKKLPKAVYELMELGYSAIAAFKLIKQIKKDRPDVIYERYNLYQPAGIVISKIFKIPLILEVNAPLKEERERFSGGLGLPSFAKAVENFTWRGADHVLPVTDVLAEHLRKVNVPENRITVVHNGIRKQVLERFESRDVHEKTNVTIGFVGFMHLTCGVEKAIEVLARNQEKDLRLVCVGNGNVVDELKAKAESLGVADKVEFTGLLGREDVFERVKDFDITLQPAVTEYASPLKMFEYMVAKSLIVAPRMKNIEEILDDGTAILFDEGEFETALEEAVQNFAMHSAKRDAAFERLKERGFIWQQNAERIVSIAQSYIDNRK